MYLTHPDLQNYYIFDIEGDGLYPSRIWCMCVINAATGEQWKLIGHDEIKSWFERAGNGIILCGHNCISYDIPHLNRLLGLSINYAFCVDTLVLSYLFDPRLSGHSLEDWALRLRLPYQKVEHSDWSRFSENMLVRCMTDVVINRELFLRLTKKMRQYGYSELSCEIEHQIRRIIDVQQSNGFYFDIHGAEKLLRDLRRRQTDLAEPIQRVFPPVLVPVKELKLRRTKGGVPHKSYLKNVARHSKVEIEGEYYICYDWQEFNIASPKQRLEKLLELGYKPIKLTKKGNPQIDEESLVEAAKTLQTPELQLMADYLVEFGRGNMVETWLKFVNRADSRIHGKIFTCGAGSRRMIHTQPNCVPLYSQALTRNGWKFHHELVIGEDVLAYDLKTRTKKWTPLLDVSVFPRAEIYSFGQKHPRKRLYCTKNHSWVVRGRDEKGYNSTEKLIEARYLKHNRPIKVNAPFENNVKESNFKLIQEKNVSQTGDTWMRTKDMSLQYEGVEPVWCPTTEFGTWIMKQGDFITITGNTANIPALEAKYGYECRSLWQATPGEFLCGYDAKALQMRIFGHYLGNVETARLYIEGDPHQANSESIGYGVGRKPAKNLFYAFIFGAQDKKLGRMVEKDKEFGSHIRKRLYTSTPGLQQLVERVQSEFHENSGRLKCLDGGLVKCPSKHAALNYYVQPGEVCIMKKAAIILDSKLTESGIEHRKVGDIHDEGIHETSSEKEAHEIGRLSQEALKESGESFNLIVPIEGDYRVGRTWAETHG